MPGPGGTQQAFEVQHQPQHVNLLRGQSGPVIEKPSSYQFGKQTVSGAAAGAVSAGWIGSAIGAGVGLVGDVVGYFANKKQQERANKFNKEQAEASFAREQMAQREVAQWNSEMAQVERLKKAGLSPALAYGQMSPSTMQAASSDAASAAAMPNQSFGGAASGAEAGASAAISAIQADALIGLQQAEGAKAQVERMQIEIDNITRHRQNLAQLEAQLASGNLDRASAERVRLLMDVEKQQLESSIDNLKASTSQFNANAAYISGPQTNLANADIGLKSAQTATEKERPALLQSEKALNEENAKLSQQQKMESMEREASLYYANREYSAHWNMVESVLKSHDIDLKYTPAAIKFLTALYPEIAQKGTQAIESWIDGGQWIDFFSRWLASKNIGRANAFGHILEDEKKN